MDNAKKFLGILWMALSGLAAWFCIFDFGLPKLTTGKQEDLVFGIIILFILTPLISLGLAVFGWYALKGEYGRNKR